MKKKYKCLNLNDYILPGYEEITGDELYLINGGGRIDNSNEAVAGISTTSASVGISLGRFSSKENAAGAYISYGASGGLSGVSVGATGILSLKKE